MPPIVRTDPYAAYNFEVTITGVSEASREAKGSFAEVFGLDVEIEAIEYRNGSEDITPRKIPGLKRFGNLTLRRGVTGDLEFWNWVKGAINGNVLRTDGFIALLDENRQEVMRWNFARAWPCRYRGPGLNALSGEIALETLEIAVERIEIDG